jgi:hypothetical protein
VLRARPQHCKQGRERAAAKRDSTPLLLPNPAPVPQQPRLCMRTDQGPCICSRPVGQSMHSMGCVLWRLWRARPHLMRGQSASSRKVRVRGQKAASAATNPTSTPACRACSTQTRVAPAAYPPHARQITCAHAMRLCSSSSYGWLPRAQHKCRRRPRTRALCERHVGQAVLQAGQGADEADAGDGEAGGEVKLGEVRVVRRKPAAAAAAVRAPG